MLSSTEPRLAPIALPVRRNLRGSSLNRFFVFAWCFLKRILHLWHKVFAVLTGSERWQDLFAQGRVGVIGFGDAPASTVSVGVSGCAETTGGATLELPEATDVKGGVGAGPISRLA